MYKYIFSRVKLDCACNQPYLIRIHTFHASWQPQWVPSGRNQPLTTAQFREAPGANRSHCPIPPNLGRDRERGSCGTRRARGNGNAKEE